MLAAIGRRLRREPDDVNADPALRGGRRGARARRRARRSACRSCRSTRSSARVDRARDFDRASAPPPARVRARWERIASAHAPRRVDAADLALPDRRPVLRARRPPPRVGRRARWAARTSTPTSPRCVTRVGADRAHTRVPTCRSRATSGCSASACRCPREQRARIQLTDPWDYGVLAEARRGVGLPRDAGPRRVPRPRARSRGLWFDEEYEPGRRDAARGGHASARRHRDRRLPARRRRSATGCCARTSGATRCSSACAREERAAQPAGGSRSGGGAVRRRRRVAAAASASG